MPFDKSYWTKMATDAGLPSDQVEAIAANEKLLSQLANGYKRQDEFSREMDAAKRTQAEAQAAQQAAVQKYQENLKWFSDNEQNLSKAQRADALAQQVAAYQALYGTMDGQQPITPVAPKPADQPQYVTADQIALSQRNIWTLMKQVERAKEQYANHFGKPMPVAMIDELEAAAQKPENANRAVPDLFNEHIAPMLEEHRATQQKEREDRIRTEAYQQGIAKGRTNEPSVDNPESVSPFYANRVPTPPANRPDEGAMMNDFVAALHEPRPLA